MTRSRTAGELLGSRPHTDLPSDDESESEYQAGDLPEAGEYRPTDYSQDDDDEGDDDEIAATATESEREQKEHENRLEEANEQLNDLLEDAEEGDLKLTDFQRYWRRLQAHILHHVDQTWRLAGPTRDAAARAGTIVSSGQKVGSHLTQLYAQRHLGVNFTPFDPGPDIMERPGADKLMIYSRPIRERSLGAQLNRLTTLANTDLQLAKVRTLFSAFDEDQTVNRAPIRAWRRVTTSEKPCALCEIAADQLYFTDDLMAIHDNCMCDVEMADADDISEHEAHYHHIGFVQTLLDIGEQKKDIETLADADAPAEDYYNLTKIEQHGELGPVITWAGQVFTGPKDLPNPLPIRPVPTVSGPGRAHEERIAENRARVEQYRRQHFGPGGRAEPQYAEGHGEGSTHVPTQYGLPPVAKTIAPKPERPKPKPIEMGHVVATIGPGGKVTIEKAGKLAEKAERIDWDTASLDDMLDYMARNHAEQVPRGSWRMSLWTSPKYNRVAKRRTLQAIDEMLNKYPDVKIDGGFKIEKLEDGVVAETRYNPRLNGHTASMVFNSMLMERTPAEVTNAFKASEEAGLYFSGASEDPYRAMVYHEYGHVLDVRGTNVARQQANRILAEEFVASGVEPTRENMAAWMAEKDRLSGYSMADFVVPGRISPLTGKLGGLGLSPGEAVAQAFDDVERRGEQASDVSKRLHAEVVERAKVPYPKEPETPVGYKPAALTAVEELRKATQIKVPWTAAEFAKEDNPQLTAEQRKYAKALAIRTYRDAAGVEKGISATATSAVTSLGGTMSGFDFRLKTGPSLYRKIQAEAIEATKKRLGKESIEAADVRLEDLDDARNDIKDAVRYTGVMPEEGYWEKGGELRKALESFGAKTIKDPVGIPLNGYRGRNMAFTMNGVPFEMQVHTELGVATKDEAHKLYNVVRDLQAKAKGHEYDAQIADLQDQMQRKWDTMPITKGTPVVQTEKDAKSGDPNKVLYVAKDTRYRGPTIEGGEAALGSPEMIPRERVPSTRYGMDWLPDSPEAKIVAPARGVPEEMWDALPVQILPHGTHLKANEGTLKKKSIDKVVGGNEPFREGYYIKLFKTDDGLLHIVDGHTRVAMYYALGRDMPVRIMDQADMDRLWAAQEAHDALRTLPAEPKAKKAAPVRYGPGGKFDAPFPVKSEDVADKGIGFLDHQHLVANIMARYNDTVGENAWIRSAGEKWYPAARVWVLKLLDATGSDMDLDTAAAVVAQFSENASWTANMVRAMNYFTGQPTTAFKATDARVKAIVAADDPLSATRGPKINNFVRAILGADRFPDAVAVDRWAARIALGTDDKDLASKILGRSGGYEALADAYRDAARKLGIPPSELQAVTWVHAVPADKTVAAFKEAGEWAF